MISWSMVNPRLIQKASLRVSLKVMSTESLMATGSTTGNLRPIQKANSTLTPILNLKVKPKVTQTASLIPRPILNLKENLKPIRKVTLKANLTLRPKVSSKGKVSSKVSSKVSLKSIRMESSKESWTPRRILSLKVIPKVNSRGNLTVLLPGHDSRCSRPNHQHRHQTC